MRSRLIDDLIAAAAKNSEPAKDVRVGVSWTAVHGKYCGLAKTYGLPVSHGNYTHNMGRLIGAATVELAEYAQSWNLVEASIGCAAITSMAAPPAGSPEVNAQEIVLEKGAGARVVVVGAFPFITKLKAVAREVHVLELDPSLQDTSAGILPDSAAEYLIPDCGLLVITGSTMVNKSLERLLALARESRAYTVILGPSTVMSEVLFDYGADMLAGAVVLNPEAVMMKLSQSGGMLDTRVCPGEIAFRVMRK